MVVRWQFQIGYPTAIELPSMSCCIAKVTAYTPKETPEQSRLSPTAFIHSTPVILLKCAISTPRLTNLHARLFWMRGIEYQHYINDS